MLQRAVFGIRDCLDIPAFVVSSDVDARALLMAAATGRPETGLLNSLFGEQRQLYKRWWQSGQNGNPELFQLIAHRPYTWLVRLSGALAKRLTESLDQEIDVHEILVDAPPAKLEVQFRIEICDQHQQSWRPLASVSPVVDALARRQFDDFVKQVRVFVHPRLKKSLDGLVQGQASQIVRQAVSLADCNS